MNWSRLLKGIVLGYFSWLAFMLVHELGHVMHALISGGRIVSVSIPLLGFSRTLVDPNPHTHFVVWRGPVWGVLIPLIVYLIFRIAHHKLPDVMRFFTGLCLIANGVYIGSGWLFRAGDARQLVAYGTPVPVMVCFGIVCTILGLFFWHRTQALSLRH